MLAALSAAVIASCKKKEDDPAPANPSSTTTTGGGSTSNMGNFFTQNATASQTFTVSASLYQVISGTGGTQIVIPPGSFVTQANVPVTGSVTIELKELYTKKDMILSGMVPTAGAFPLVSGGEFFIKATQGGQALKLSGSASVTALVPAGSTPSYQMNEFYAGNITAADSSGWSTNNDSTSVVQDTTGFGSSTFYYSFQIDSMNWINCDYFWNDPAPRTDITANVGTQFNASNCVVFMSVNGQNSIGQLYNYSGTFESWNWPTGKAVTFVAIAEISGQYYSAFQSATLGMNHVENLTLTATTLSQIQTQLSALP